MSTRLAQDFYQQDTIEVARQLLGKRLVHRLPDGTRRSGIVVETEAYLGSDDPAAHSFAGRRTPRTEVMFGEPGYSYVYFIYGMHHCLNVVTMARDNPQAVLLRALELREGVKDVCSRRPSTPVHLLANGPGKLCSALELKLQHNGLDLTHSKILWLEDGDTDQEIIQGPRIGIGNRHDAVHWPLRFGLRAHPSLSPPKWP